MDDAIGRDVASHAGIALHHCEVADVDELVNPGPSAQEDAAAQSAVAGHHDVIGNDVVIANLDIVTEVGDGHEEVAIADDGVSVLHRAAVHGDVLSKGVTFANENACSGGGIETKILGGSANDGAVTY